MKVLIDMLNIIFIEFHVAKKKLHDEGKMLDEENLPFYAHLLFNKLNFLFQTYGELEICWEGKQSLEWRRSIYPEYKRNRDKSKSEDEYLTLKSFIPKIEEVLNYYPCRQYKVDEAEGDDLMYSLSKHFSEQNEKVLVLSSDGDLVQFQNFWPDNVEVYNPIRRQFAKIKPNILKEKAICGDASDNIPGLFRIGPKTFEKMLDDNNKWNEIINKGSNKSIYEMFNTIIDLRKAPKSISQKVNSLVLKDYNSFKPGKIELFFWENKLKNNIERWGKVQTEIWKVIEQKQNINLVQVFVDKDTKDEEEKTQEEIDIDSVLAEFF